MKYRLTARRKEALHRIGVELGKFAIIAGFILFMGLLNGLVEMIP